MGRIWYEEACLAAAPSSLQVRRRSRRLQSSGSDGMIAPSSPRLSSVLTPVPKPDQRSTSGAKPLGRIRSWKDSGAQIDTSEALR